MGKYVIENIGSIIINGEEYPWSSCDIEMTQEEIRGGLGTYKPKFEHIENTDKYGLSKKGERLKWEKNDIK